ncbi:MAG TPA: ATP-dependent DNA helicase PcrA [Candidatus Moranbacteria bacterium]|nr:ATP-dependent DNA helicase PcrA [Candidatus Moranbacteria bacterium]HAT75154.1 ATP-dependent DNA helicase PcrA [Candidatus Moranbacteria bacterium]
MSNILENLNSSQREAVETTEGAVLVIAGAGSGKTRALTYRTVYLICEKNIPPRNILAVTFTNKAAAEMKERIAGLLADSNLRMECESTNSKKYGMPMVGTFHSICARILRSEIKKLDFSSNFNIFDAQDQQSLIKKTMKELNIDTTQFRPQSILGTISKAKNELIDAQAFQKSAGGYWEDIAAKVYVNYQERLKKNNALDFDDILMFLVEIFRKFPEVLEKYQNIFRYIMVDEYQDTNHAQYTLIKMLADKHKNICVVGDDWQGIYSWRGANIQNILDFEKDYPSAKVVKLEQNYRSSQQILDAAYGVISKNVNRNDKKIWTENKAGHLLVSYEAENEGDEARFIVSEVISLCNRGVKLNNIVVLYRTNAQSRIIEESMLADSIPYRIIGGLKFYQRKEIKDIIAYLRLIENFNDEISLERIINEPKRGIGEKTVEKWTAFAKRNSLDLIIAGLEILDDKIIKTKAENIARFCEFIKRMREIKNNLSLADFIQKVFLESGYEKQLLDGTDEGQMRYENARELLTVAKKYDGYENGEGLSLFLEEVALVADTDNIDQSSEAVHLMTLHSAKGLEFQFVFIAGLEEGILPHSRSLLSEPEMEEERRLMYVGITRAKQKVYLLFTKMRSIFGSTQINAPSRFLDDIPEELIESAELSGVNIKANEFIAGRKKTVLTENKETFKGGEKIVHEKFGKGLVIASQGDIITVAFQSVGLKKLSSQVAPIKRVG